MPLPPILRQRCGDPRIGNKEGEGDCNRAPAAASIALSTAANAQVWVGAGSTAWWGGYWHYDRGHLGPTANNYWRYYRIPCQVVRDGSGQWWVTRCM